MLNCKYNDFICLGEKILVRIKSAQETVQLLGRWNCAFPLRIVTGFLAYGTDKLKAKTVRMKIVVIPAARTVA